MNRILSTIIIALAFFGMDVGALAQTLSVDATSVRAGGNTVLVVKAEGLSADVSALQFNLALPQGATLDEANITKGEAASGHTLEIRPLANNDRLFVLYNLDMASIGNGELLRLPMTIDGTNSGEEGKLYTVRTATTDAVSHTCTDTQFAIDLVIRGDVNGDGIVNGTDIQAIINTIVEGEYDEKADVNEDDQVNGTDIQEVINIIVNAE